MSTKRESILAAAATALTGTSGVSTRIYRSRAEPLARAEFPALVLEPVTDKASREAIGRLSWELLFQVVVLARHDVPDQSADPTIADVHSKLMGNTPLNALLSDLLPASVDFHFVEADQTLGVITMQFSAKYITNETSI